MGKGKAKGWRPPAGDDPALGMLYGSAAHLTGDTVASPVQLREEGRAIPQGHPNFGEEWTKGYGKGGKGKGGKDKGKEGAAKESGRPAAEPPAAAPKPPAVKEEAPEAPEAAAGGSSGSSAKPKPEVPPKDDATTEIERRRAETAKPKPEVPPTSDGMTEIERRRAEMAKRAEAQPQPAFPPTPPFLEAAPSSHADGLTEIERRRAELEKLQAAEAAGTCKEEKGEEPSAKRPCPGGGETAPAAAQPGSGAVQQGLQGWAQRVNALAEQDESLTIRCRNFVRKRILKAHAEGNLHSVDWGAEPVPTLEGLRMDD